MTTVEIKHRITGDVLFSCEVGDDVRAELRVRVAVEAAIKAGANLAGANLAGAYLAGANLAGANLAGANLAGAYLAGAYLARAYLARAYLADAYLADAYLAGAYLAGANLAGAKIRDDLVLTGKRPCMWIGPIGTVARTFYGWMTDKGIRIQTGCFFGTTTEFRTKVERERGGSIHEREYLAALELIERHFDLFPADESTKPADKSEAA